MGIFKKKPEVPYAPSGSTRIPGTDIYVKRPPANPQGITVNHGGKGTWETVPTKEEKRG